jgi:hypothetical protein
MNHSEKGAALVVSLVLLVVGLMLAISGVQSARLEESMAGNHRAYSLALMAADTGASNWLANPTDASDLTEVDCADGWESVGGEEDADPGNLTGVDLRYQVEMCKIAGAAYRVKSRGMVFSDADAISYRDVVLETFLLGPGFLNLSPINVVSDLDAARMANSNKFYVDGDSSDGDLRPAISAGSKENAKLLLECIYSNNPNSCNGNPSEGEDYFVTEGCEGVECENVRYECNPDSGGRLCNYRGGVTSEAGSAIFEDPNQFAQLIEYSTGKHTRDEQKKNWDWDGGESPSLSELPGVTYVDNLTDASGRSDEVIFVSKDTLAEDGERHQFVHGGNFSGSGVLIIDGDVEFKGVPGFDGVIIALGDYVIDGSGGGEVNGAIVAFAYGCDANTPSGCDKESVLVDIGGGGNASYNYDIGALVAAFSLLPDAARDLMDVVDAPDEGDTAFVAQRWAEQIHTDE